MKKYIYISTLLFTLCGACSDNKDLGTDSSDPTIDNVVVQLESRKAAPGMDQLAEGEAKEIVIDNSILTPGSILYISQMGPDNNRNPNFDNPSTDAVPYQYQYAYNENNEADWDEGFNFSTEQDRLPIIWKTVKQLGSVGNSFSFYAMFFPLSSAPVFSVNSDQTGGVDNPYDDTKFKQSDILGAYHATTALFTRMRFRLFHLMTYLKITLYVPIYQDAITGNDQTYSGFEAGALTEAYLLGATTDFSIDWRADRSSDTEPPLVKNSNSTPTPIKMYMHEPEFNEPIEITVSNYDKNPQLETDNVWAYNFSVLFPQQPKDNIRLCFPIKSKDDNVKYYYFSASNVKDGTGDFDLKQGTLQQLYLYLPRKDNETILIGAKILPWGNSTSDMTVYEQQSNI